MVRQLFFVPRFLFILACAGKWLAKLAEIIYFVENRRAKLVPFAKRRGMSAHSQQNMVMHQFVANLQQTHNEYAESKAKYESVKPLKQRLAAANQKVAF